MDIVRLLLEKLTDWPVITLAIILMFRRPIAAIIGHVGKLL
jgi:hypothetical protein